MVWWRAMMVYSAHECGIHLWLKNTLRMQFWNVMHLPVHICQSKRASWETRYNAIGWFSWESSPPRSPTTHGPCRSLEQIPYLYKCWLIIPVDNIVPSFSRQHLPNSFTFEYFCGVRRNESFVFVSRLFFVSRIIHLCCIYLPESSHVIIIWRNWTHFFSISYFKGRFWLRLVSALLLR